MNLLSDLLMLLAVAVIGYGISLVYLPAAIVAVGVWMFIASVRISSKTRKGP